MEANLVPAPAVKMAKSSRGGVPEEESLLTSI